MNNIFIYINEKMVSVSKERKIRKVGSEASSIIYRLTATANKLTYGFGEIPTRS